MASIAVVPPAVAPRAVFAVVAALVLALIALTASACGNGGTEATSAGGDDTVFIGGWRLAVGPGRAEPSGRLPDLFSVERTGDGYTLTMVTDRETTSWSSEFPVDGTMTDDTLVLDFGSLLGSLGGEGMTLVLERAGDDDHVAAHWNSPQAEFSTADAPYERVDPGVVAAAMPKEPSSVPEADQFIGTWTANVGEQTLTLAISKRTETKYWQELNGLEGQLTPQTTPLVAFVRGGEPVLTDAFSESEIDERSTTFTLTGDDELVLVDPRAYENAYRRITFERVSSEPAGE